MPLRVSFDPFDEAIVKRCDNAFIWRETRLVKTSALTWTAREKSLKMKKYMKAETGNLHGIWRYGTIPLLYGLLMMSLLQEICTR
jgi:hypothetical protein